MMNRNVSEFLNRTASEYCPLHNLTGVQPRSVPCSPSKSEAMMAIGAQPMSGIAGPIN